MISPPPLGLYVHFPWCERKCPYCDFNSHAIVGDIPDSEYVDALLQDLHNELRRTGDRAINTVFFGGGTPSLISAKQIARVMTALHGRLADNAEVTLEANPGSAEAQRFHAYLEAGVNRLSIGVQSFDDGCLDRLGRIHSSDDAVSAFNAAADAGFDRINIDLMYGLPGQDLAMAAADLRTALALDPGHISHYQLTLEPGTVFAAKPPALPDSHQIDQMLTASRKLYRQAGYRRYEISALARPGHRARHNLNYWLFGDYIGIGAGAHSKITVDGSIIRARRPRLPARYQRDVASAEWRERTLSTEEAAFEFMLNTMRLGTGFHHTLLLERAGVAVPFIREGLQAALSRKLLQIDDGWIRPTALGGRFLNDLQALFLPPDRRKTGAAVQQ